MNRDELEHALREIIVGCSSTTGDCEDCACPGSGIVYRAMAAVDAYSITLGLSPDELPNTELWTAEEVATYVGLQGAHAGRSWLSRAGIARRGTRAHPESGRPQSLYPANHVRAEVVKKVPK